MTQPFDVSVPEPAIEPAAVSPGGRRGAPTVHETSRATGVPAVAG